MLVTVGLWFCQDAYAGRIDSRVFLSDYYSSLFLSSAEGSSRSSRCGERLTRISSFIEYGIRLRRFCLNYWCCFRAAASLEPFQFFPMKAMDPCDRLGSPRGAARFLAFSLGPVPAHRYLQFLSTPSSQRSSVSPLRRYEERSSSKAGGKPSLPLEGHLEALNFFGALLAALFIRFQGRLTHSY